MCCDDDRFWPVIDDALRTAAITRRVEVHLLASLWNHTSPDMLKFLDSLSRLNGIRKSKIEVVRLSDLLCNLFVCFLVVFCWCVIVGLCVILSDIEIIV